MENLHLESWLYKTGIYVSFVYLDDANTHLRVNLVPGGTQLRQTHLFDHE